MKKKTAVLIQKDLKKEKKKKIQLLQEKPRTRAFVSGTFCGGLWLFSN